MVDRSTSGGFIPVTKTRDEDIAKEIRGNDHGPQVDQRTISRRNREGWTERNALGLRRGCEVDKDPRCHPQRVSPLEFELERRKERGGKEKKKKKARYRGTSSLFPLRFQLSDREKEE